MKGYIYLDCVSGYRWRCLTIGKKGLSQKRGHEHFRFFPPLHCVSSEIACLREGIQLVTETENQRNTIKQIHVKNSLFGDRWQGLSKRRGDEAGAWINLLFVTTPISLSSIHPASAFAQKIYILVATLTSLSASFWSVCIFAFCPTLKCHQYRCEHMGSVLILCIYHTLLIDVTPLAIGVGWKIDYKLAVAIFHTRATPSI